MEDEIEDTREQPGLTKKMPERFSCSVPKSVANSVKVGARADVSISGVVIGITKEYGRGNTYRLEMEYKVTPDVKFNRADASLRDLMGDKPSVGRFKNEADKSLDDIYHSKERAY